MEQVKSIYLQLLTHKEQKAIRNLDLGSALREFIKQCNRYFSNNMRAKRYTDGISLLRIKEKDLKITNLKLVKTVQASMAVIEQINKIGNWINSLDFQKLNQSEKEAILIKESELLRTKTIDMANDLNSLAQRPLWKKLHANIAAAAIIGATIVSGIVSGYDLLCMCFSYSGASGGAIIHR